MDMRNEFRRGEVYIANLEPVVGSEQGGKERPVLIISNNNGNHYSSTLIIAPISTRKRHGFLPTHVKLPKHIRVAEHTSVILLEQIRTIDKERIGEYVGSISWKQMAEVEIAILISLGLLNARTIKLRELAVKKMEHKRFKNKIKET